jgi:membrane protein required for colicin V production
MQAFTALDIFVLLLVGGGLVFGFLRGFIGEVLSLLAWIAGIVALKAFHDPITNALEPGIGTRSGASVLSFALVFGIAFVLVKLLARRIGGRVRSSVVGPVDRVLGGGFGMLKGLIGATLIYLAANLATDTIWGRAAERPEWMTASRTYPLLHASGRAIIDFVESRRGYSDPAAVNNL